jgi:ADP-ribosyl-[dinitrogen reductase] hydrolase
MTRTSRSHPLRIDAVSVPNCGGEIGMTLCPGRRDRLSAEGAWERDLNLDLEVIAAWQPAFFVTLIEGHEFDLLGVPEFSQSLREWTSRSACGWLRLPIPDAGIPDARFEAAWCENGARLRAALRAGRRVLLHCRAGLGRTGMIAARLLVELGMPPSDAVAAVRHARSSSAIETLAQERHVHRQRRVDDEPAAVPAHFPPELRSRFLGSLLGGAIGDALGAAFEFVSSEQIEAALGSPIVRDFLAALPGSLMHPRAPAIPTDDTAMTIALLESLVQTPPPLTIDALHATLCATLNEREHPASTMFWKGGPGGACVAMLHAARAGAGPFENLNPQAGGNGAAMRAHVCGLFPHRAFVAKLAELHAKLSHPHPAAVAAAQTIALIAHDGFYTGTFTTALPPEITEPKMVAAWEAAHQNLIHGDRLPPHLRDVDMAGWNTVSAAHAIAQLYADDPETAIGLAAASGRDTDTIASMVGAMLGAAHGVDALPERWLAGLQARETLMPWGEKMLKVAHHAAKLDQPFVAFS